VSSVQWAVGKAGGWAVRQVDKMEKEDTDMHPPSLTLTAHCPLPTAHCSLPTAY
jgi:hypothetical protein